MYKTTPEFRSKNAKLREWTNADVIEQERLWNAWKNHTGTPGWSAFFKGWRVGAGEITRAKTMVPVATSIARGYFNAGVLVGKEWKKGSRK